MQLDCRDLGFDCDTVFSAMKWEELHEQLIQHARDVHNFEDDDFTPDLERKIKSLVRRP